METALFKRVKTAFRNVLLSEKIVSEKGYRLISTGFTDLFLLHKRLIFMASIFPAAPG